MILKFITKLQVKSLRLGRVQTKEKKKKLFTQEVEP